MIVGSPVNRWLGPLDVVAKTLLLRQVIRRKLVLLMAAAKRDDLLVLKELVETGRVKPVIDRMYPLSETAEAMRHLEAGRARGKLVLDVDQAEMS